MGASKQPVQPTTSSAFGSLSSKFNSGAVEMNDNNDDDDDDIDPATLGFVASLEIERTHTRTCFAYSI